MTLSKVAKRRRTRLIEVRIDSVVRERKTEDEKSGAKSGMDEYLAGYSSW